MAQLIDIMVKNLLQTELGQDRLETLEYAALHSKDISENHVCKDLIDPHLHFSKGAKRNFEMIKQVLLETDVGIQPDFEAEV